MAKFLLGVCNGLAIGVIIGAVGLMALIYAEEVENEPLKVVEDK